MPDFFAQTPQATKVNLGLTSSQRKIEDKSALPPLRVKGLFSLIKKDIKDIAVGLGSFTKKSLFKLIGIKLEEKLKF